MSDVAEICKVPPKLRHG